MISADKGTSKLKNICRAISLILFSFVLYTQVIWGIVAATQKSDIHSNDFSPFLKYFPPFARDIAIITYSTLACSIILIIFSTMWQNRSQNSEKVFGIVVMILAYLITLLTLFQLM